MYLKQIRANGFKSFAQKTIIDLTKGISGVVGPNGSGKSNIVDAVRWVLGEQSVKELRGEGLMSDVIFSGSKSRKAATSASVTLVFDNSDRTLQIDYTEVEIKRVIYNTGENEYYINNEKVRLKDINELFFDTGVSKESFNIISQGDISTILSNKPDERRIIFEAAAGTLKYRKRKDEALRKLDKAHDNMARVNDIIYELESNLEPLKKQSVDAKKYLENKNKLDEIEVSLIVSEVSSLNKEYQENKKMVLDLREELIKLETSNNVDNSKLAMLRSKSDIKEEELYTLQNKYAKCAEETQVLLGKKDLVIERQKYNTNDIRVQENIINIKENILKKENEIFGINNNLEIIRKKLDDLNEKINQNNILYNKLKQEHDFNENKLKEQNRLENEIKYKIDMLNNQIESNSLIPYSVKSILDNPKLAGIHGIIGNLIDVNKDYSMAISTALSSSCNFIVTDDEFSAKEAINYLKINKFGRATFFPLNIIKAKEIDNETYRILKNEFDFVGIASDLVSYDSRYDGIIKNQLGTTVVVTNLDSANYIARKINYRYRIVTLDGELLHVGGSLTGGAIKNNNNLISQKHDLEDSKILYKNLQSKRAILEEEINKQDDKYKEILNERDNLHISKNNLELSLNYENNKKQENEIILEKLKEEINNINSLENNTLKDEEEKIIELYYEKEKEKNEIKNKLEYTKQECVDLKEEIEKLQRDSKINNSEYYKKADSLKNLEITVTRQDVTLDNLLNTLTDDYAITYEKAKNEYFLDMDEKEARKIVDKCKSEIKKLKDVNIGSIEEYDRVNTRLEFLNNQKKDLENAQNTILEIIKELDDIMKERFLSTFNKVQEEFKNVFKKLFSGGNASLTLTNPDDILTTGIDIKALPPGKTLKHISLLSGGEKTLTAISLLFAILKTRPVAFCILDEVEAALDEVNVDNFGKFLNEFKDKTQFIVITHKKKTMEYADVLYGVTMQESGVSKLVSVKLEDIKDNK